MLRTLAFVGVAAVAYNQLRKNGSLDRFTADLKRRADDLRAHVDAQRAGHRTPEASPSADAGVAAA